MTGFRVALVIMFAVIAGYSGVVIANHGMGLFSIFFSDIAAMTWPGQFDLDFMFMLMFSALWVGYRHRFSAVGLLLGLGALVGGSLFLTVYLSVESYRCKGDVTALLLGRNHAVR